jgi:hypothetical protein
MPPRDPYSTTPEPRTAVQGPMAPPRADAPGAMETSALDREINASKQQQSFIMEPLSGAMNTFSNAGSDQGIAGFFAASDNPVLDASRRAVGYVGDMGIGAMQVGDAAARFGISALADAIPFMGDKSKQRLSRDVYAMPEAFAGAGPSLAANVGKLPTAAEASMGTRMLMDTTADLAGRVSGEIRGNLTALAERDWDFLQATLNPKNAQSLSAAVKDKGGNWIRGRHGDSWQGATALIEELKPETHGFKALNFNEIEPAFEAWDKAFENKGAWRNVLDMGREKLAIGTWIDTKLKKYLETEFGTESDPVRNMMDKGRYVERDRVLRAGDEPITLSAPEETYLGKTVDARKWEDNAARSIYKMNPEVAKGRVVDYRALGKKQAQQELDFPDSNKSDAFKANLDQALEAAGYSWLGKLDPDAPVYELSGGVVRNLGLRHVVDELTNSLDPMSGLPDSLKWNYKDLKNVSVSQAVDRVAQIDAWREQNRLKENLKLAENEATVTVKEYPEGSNIPVPGKGFKWVQLRIPDTDLPEGFSVVKVPGWDSYEVRNNSGVSIAQGKTPEAARRNFVYARKSGALKAALRYEGDTMSHCVGSYCDDVLAGRTEIFSLRDGKGEPHVTIEVRAGDKILTKEAMDALEPGFYDSNIATIQQAKTNPSIAYTPPRSRVLGFLQDNRPDILEKLPVGKPSIVQIKGKGNRRPAEKYVPLAQDFVKDGDWKDIGDMGNADMVLFQGKAITKTELEEISAPAIAWLEESNLPKSTLAYDNTGREYDISTLLHFFNMDYDGKTYFEVALEAVENLKNTYKSAGIPRKAEGGPVGIGTLNNTAKDMFRGPRGVGAFMSYMVEGGEAQSPVSQAAQAVKKEYPMFEDVPVFDSTSKGMTDDRQMEAYLTSEDSPYGAPGIEVFNPNLQGEELKSAVLGEMLHYAPEKSEKYRLARQDLLKSMTPEQEGYFKAWHEKDAQSGDKRDFNTWMEVSGLDSFIRGKAVGQWPDFPYTTEQGTIVNKMMGLLAPVQGIGALNETARKMFR